MAGNGRGSACAAGGGASAASVSGGNGGDTAAERGEPTCGGEKRGAGSRTYVDVHTCEGCCITTPGACVLPVVRAESGLVPVTAHA